MAIKFDDGSNGVDVRMQGKLFGTITTGGRWPGRFKVYGLTGFCPILSEGDLKKIAEKCSEIRQQVESTLMLRRTHFR